MSDLTLRKIFEIRLDSLPHAPPGRQVVRYLENFCEIRLDSLPHAPPGRPVVRYLENFSDPT